MSSKENEKDRLELCLYWPLRLEGFLHDQMR